MLRHYFAAHQGQLSDIKTKNSDTFVPLPENKEEK